MLKNQIHRANQMKVLVNHMNQFMATSNVETCRQRKSRIIQRKIVSYAAKSLSPDRLTAPVKSVCFQQSTEESPPETSNSTINDLISNV
uniref:Uncharacterized protein n=1 Tax=Panagrolaimus superbus TaxID=310955 RepID=A0A914XUU0_9BILA